MSANATNSSHQPRPVSEPFLSDSLGPNDLSRNSFYSQPATDRKSITELTLDTASKTNSKFGNHDEQNTGDRDNDDVIEDESTKDLLREEQDICKADPVTESNLTHETKLELRLQTQDLEAKLEEALNQLNKFKDLESELAHQKTLVTALEEGLVNS